MKIINSRSMMAGTSGIAIFPADLSEDLLLSKYRGRCIEHFAFNVTNEVFEKAGEYLSGRDIAFRFQDHIHFHSMYLFTPDDHEVELTTCIGENRFD